ncbi:ABC transporter permease subunit [Vibrio sp.]|nr:ABC transporter permease subunit [Vibrio sp.]
MSTNNVYQESHIPTQLERCWNTFQRNTLAMFGLWYLGFLLLISILAPIIEPHDPNYSSIHLLLPPSWYQEGDISYFLGTDDLGRDILSRLLNGTRITFGFALCIAILAALIGCTIGAIAGMTQGLISSTLNHLLDTIMSIPSLLLAVIFVAFFGFGEMNVLIAIGIALIPRFIRAIYISVHNEMEKDYVTAARLDGSSGLSLFISTVLPNILVVLAHEATYALSIAILDITALGFLGLGAQSPTPEWGTMIGDSVSLIYSSIWTVALPGLAIMLTIIAINLVGNGVRQALNSGIE